MTCLWPSGKRGSQCPRNDHLRRWGPRATAQGPCIISLLNALSVFRMGTWKFLKWWKDWFHYRPAQTTNFSPLGKQKEWRLLGKLVEEVVWAWIDSNHVFCDFSWISAWFSDFPKKTFQGAAAQNNGFHHFLFLQPHYLTVNLDASPHDLWSLVDICHLLSAPWI